MSVFVFSFQVKKKRPRTLRHAGWNAELQFGKWIISSWNLPVGRPAFQLFPQQPQHRFRHLRRGQAVFGIKFLRQIRRLAELAGDAERL